MPALAVGLAACSAKSSPPGPSTTGGSSTIAPATSTPATAQPSPTTSTTSLSTTTAGTPTSSTTTAGSTTGTTGAAFCYGGKPGSSTTIVIQAYHYLTCPDTVGPGATITVKNTDTVTHTVTAVGAHKGAFDTGFISGGSSKTFKAPTTPGAYEYICTLHPFMHGTLIVK
ncbi:MAG: cupredoxin domain-containing protein [Acidimicrobiales bacterium]